MERCEHFGHTFGEAEECLKPPTFGTFGWIAFSFPIVSKLPTPARANNRRTPSFTMLFMDLAVYRRQAVAGSSSCQKLPSWTDVGLEAPDGGLVIVMFRSDRIEYVRCRADKEITTPWGVQDNVVS